MGYLKWFLMKRKHIKICCVYLATFSFQNNSNLYVFFKDYKSETATVCVNKKYITF